LHKVLSGDEFDRITQGVTTSLRILGAGRIFGDPSGRASLEADCETRLLAINTDEAIGVGAAQNKTRLDGFKLLVMCATQCFQKSQTKRRERNA
jgi:hypothetical protein